VLVCGEIPDRKLAVRDNWRVTIITIVSQTTLEC